MEKIQCTNCKAPLDWDGYEELLTCPYCGTRFDMRDKIRSKAGAQGGVLEDGIGRGTVAAIPSIVQDAYGVCFLSCYVPKGWMVRCGNSGGSSSIRSFDTFYRRTRIQRNCVVQAEKGLYTIAGGALVLTSVRRSSRADPSRVLRVYNGNSICLKL